MANGKPFTYNPRSAAKIVTEFQQYVEAAAFAGAGHPDLIEWHRERLAIARERMIRRLTGDSRPTRYMPPKPEVDYDR